MKHDPFCNPKKYVFTLVTYQTRINEKFHQSHDFLKISNEKIKDGILMHDEKFEELLKSLEKGA